MYLEDLKDCLKPTFFIDSDSPTVLKFVNAEIEEDMSDIDKAVAVYYAVRDGIIYDPYRIDLTREGMKASSIILRKKGFCVSKAVVLAACSRAAGIPARLHFADVKNHLTSDRLYELMETNVFIFHAYTELFLEGKWVKATPAFNISLCTFVGVMPLDFDGRNDSLFQQSDAKGNRFMEYVADRGAYNDLPYDYLIKEFNEYYPKFMSMDLAKIEGDFEKEAGEN
ncbi:MAG: transglutaminase domain-containing protein [Spirochaetes bacterium]|nr:transglutaminase domain-containing protein [Spirochaetota bacterium]